MTAPDIIDALGGALALAKLLDLPPTTVGNWRSRKSIPARYHHAVLEAGGGKITAEQIVLAHAGDAAADEPAHQHEAA